METIYKYPVESVMLLQIPKDSKPLCVQIQNSAPFMWIQLDNEKPTEDRIFHCIVTGDDMGKYCSSRLDYISTFQVLDLVFHVFEQVYNPK